MTRIARPATAFAAPRQRRPRVTPKGHHLTFIKSLPCISCGRPDNSDPHHLKPSCKWAAKPSAGTMRPGDEFTVPLCRKCHDALHQHGNEKMWWWQTFGKDGWSRVCRTALAFWAATGDYERGLQIVEANR